MLRLRVSVNGSGVISAGEDFDDICNFFVVLIRTLGALEVPALARDRQSVRLFKGFGENDANKSQPAVELESIRRSYEACVTKFR
jgi:hypothetical protein